MSIIVSHNYQFKHPDSPLLDGFKTNMHKGSKSVSPPAWPFLITKASPPSSRSLSHALHTSIITSTRPPHSIWAYNGLRAQYRPYVPCRLGAAQCGNFGPPSRRTSFSSTRRSSTPDGRTSRSSSRSTSFDLPNGACDGIQLDGRQPGDELELEDDIEKIDYQYCHRVWPEWTPKASFHVNGMPGQFSSDVELAVVSFRSEAENIDTMALLIIESNSGQVCFAKYIDWSWTVETEVGPLTFRWSIATNEGVCRHSLTFRGGPTDAARFAQLFEEGRALPLGTCPIGDPPFEYLHLHLFGYEGAAASAEGAQAPAEDADTGGYLPSIAREELVQAFVVLFIIRILTALADHAVGFVSAYL
ncbi:hypothetical protein C8Q80DRAFT_1275531 [Daedaleopsis nitida]|nr:hypothetical protein C8Q80DRAFT_1275531 [Daedaleopsis nitida]